MSFTSSLEEARKQARLSRPCVLLERIDNHGQFRPEVPFVWWELERYDREEDPTPAEVGG